MKKTENSSRIVKLGDNTNVGRCEEGRLACFGDICASSSGKVDDDFIFEHPLAGYEGEHACCESNFKAKYIEKWFDKESMGKPAILDVLECGNNDYITDRTTPFLSTPIESSSPGSPILAAWDGICNMIDEKFSPRHIRKGTIEMFLRREVDCKNQHLKIITPGLTAISLPIPRSLGSESETKDTALTILPGLAAVHLPLPRRLENVVETKNDILPIAQGLSAFQLPLPSALNHVARIRDDITHHVTLAEVCDP